MGDSTNLFINVKCLSQALLGLYVNVIHTETCFVYSIAEGKMINSSAWRAYISPINRSHAFKTLRLFLFSVWLGKQASRFIGHIVVS